MAQPTYGYHHQQTRRQWQPQVQSGNVTCSRHTEDPQCPGLIRPGTPWDLDHDDDGIRYRGPAHADCNRRAGAHITNSRQRHCGGTTRPL